MTLKNKVIITPKIPCVRHFVVFGFGFFFVFVKAHVPNTYNFRTLDFFPSIIVRNSVYEIVPARVIKTFIVTKSKLIECSDGNQFLTRLLGIVTHLTF